MGVASHTARRPLPAKRVAFARPQSPPYQDSILRANTPDQVTLKAVCVDHLTSFDGSNQSVACVSVLQPLAPAREALSAELLGNASRKPWRGLPKRRRWFSRLLLATSGTKRSRYLWNVIDYASPSPGVALRLVPAALRTQTHDSRSAWLVRLSTVGNFHPPHLAGLTSAKRPT